MDGIYVSREDVITLQVGTKTLQLNFDEAIEILDQLNLILKKQEKNNE